MEWTRLRRLGLAAAAALAVLVALAGGFFVFVHSGPGERWVSGKIEENVAGLELDGFHLGWPFRLRADALRLSDARGTWLEAGGLELVWHPLRLWRRVLDVDRLVARQVVVHRLPETTATGGDGGNPPLPDSLRLDELRLPIVLEAPVLGQRLALELAGTARMMGGGGPVELSLHSEDGDFLRLAGTAGTDYVDLRWYLQMPDLARWRQIIGVSASGGLGGAGVVAGRLPSPEISGRLETGAAQAGPARWEHAALSGRVTPTGGLWQGTLRAEVAGPGWNGNALPVDSASLSLLGDLAPASGRLRLGDARLATPRGTLATSGIVAEWGRYAVLRVTAHAPVLGGAAQARGMVAGDLTAGRLDGLADVSGDGIATGAAPLDRALGPHPRARLNVALRGERLFLGPSRLDGPGGQLLAAGGVLPRLDLWTRLVLPDAGVVAPTLSGSATAFAHVGGTAPAPQVAGIATLDEVAVAGAPSGSGAVAFDLPEPQRPRGHLSAELSVAGTPLAGRARLDRAAGVRLSDLVLASGPSRLTGDVEFAGGVRGRLSGSIPQLEQWEALVGRPLAGRVEAEMVLDPRREQSVQLTARGTGLMVAGQSIPTASLRGSAEGLTAATRRIRVEEADVAVAGIPLALAGPAAVEWRGDDVALAPTRLSIGSGRAELSGTLRGGTLAARAQVADLPLALAVADAEGLISGELSAQGRLAAPQLGFHLTGRNLLGRLDGLADGRWSNDLVSGRVEVRQGRVAQASAEGSVRLPGDGALDARLHATGDMERLAEVLPLGAHVVAGRLEAAATATGSLQAPRLDGRAVLTGGRYENLDSGTVVTPLQAEAVLAGDQVRVTAQGGDGGKGRLNLTGTATLAGDYGADAVLDDFVAVRRGDVEATVGGALHLADGRLAGRLRVPRAEVDVGRIKGGGPVHLEVVEINRPGPAPAQARARPAEAGPALELAVDGTVEHAFVRGRGLDSEWRGSLSVTGSADQPSVTGRLQAVRGQMDVLGKSFRLAETSTVTFQGDSPPNPALAVTAEASAADITAQVEVGGTARAPEMTFTSSPPLPQDEVLARLLFGREAGKLSAFQQIQLAQMAAGGLSGDEGGFDPVAELRSMLGLDVLGFGSETGAGGKENPTVSAGRYIGRDTFLRVDQGTTALGRVTVEQGVGAGFSVESYVGEQSGGGVGLTWRKDY